MFPDAWSWTISPLVLCLPLHAPLPTRLVPRLTLLTNSLPCPPSLMMVVCAELAANDPLCPLGRRRRGATLAQQTHNKQTGCAPTSWSWHPNSLRGSLPLNAPSLVTTQLSNPAASERHRLHRSRGTCNSDELETTNKKRRVNWNNGRNC